jgi:hypothetical protein
LEELGYTDLPDEYISDLVHDLNDEPTMEWINTIREPSPVSSDPDELPGASTIDDQDDEHLPDEGILPSTSHKKKPVGFNFDPHQFVKHLKRMDWHQELDQVVSEQKHRVHLDQLAKQKPPKLTALAMHKHSKF